MKSPRLLEKVKLEPDIPYAVTENTRELLLPECATFLRCFRILSSMVILREITKNYENELPLSLRRRIECP
jgi:hypothetical protein